MPDQASRGDNTRDRAQPGRNRPRRLDNARDLGPTADQQGMRHQGESRYGSDFSQQTFERHAALLGDPRMSHSMYAQQRATTVRQLQRDYGPRTCSGWLNTSPKSGPRQSRPN